MALRSFRFVRSVNPMMARKEVFTARKLHIIIVTYNIFLFCSIALRGVQRDQATFLRTQTM